MQPKADPALKATAITANVVMLHYILKGAAARAQEAHELLLQGEQNAAIGALLDFDIVLNEAKALYDATLALHRTTNL